MPELNLRRLAFGIGCTALLAAAGWGAPANPTTLIAHSDGAEAQSGSLRLRVTALADDILRVRIAPSGEFGEDASWAVSSSLRSRTVEVGASRGAGNAAAIEFDTALLHVSIEREPLRLIVSNLAGQVISADMPESAIDIRGGGFALRKLLSQTEHYFALGDKTGPLDHRGQAFANWNTDAYHFQESTDPLYKSIPFFVAAGGPAGSYGIFLDNTWRSWFDFGKREPQTLAFGSSGGAIDYYFIYGPSMRRVVERYTDLTGKPSLPPMWALGFQQSRYSYLSADEVRTVGARLRSERIPADVIWLDIDYQNHNRPFTINPRTFGDMPSLSADLRHAGIRLVAITDLHIAQAPQQGYAPYDSGSAGDHFVKRPDGSIYVGEVWPGPSVFPEFTRLSSRQWWGSLYREFVADGIAGFWNDMNEPAVFKTPTKTMPLDTRHRIEEPGFLPRTAAHEEIHNVYGMQNSRATFEGLLQLKPTERPFVMTRASYAGGQRYAVTWTGDNSSTWNHLNLAIGQLLNLGMSGFAYSGADVGGFIGAPSARLLTKWIEVAAFTPIFRVHSVKGSPRREPWLDGAQHTTIRRRFIEERYRLLPYLYALADENARTGAPLMRPLFYEFPDALDSPCEQPNAFLLGDRLLVAPPSDFESPSVYSICLPAGKWYDFWTGRPVSLQSKTAAISASPSLASLPVFVRAGAILPRQPLVQSTAETPQGPLTLDIYPGDDCRGTIYADDGHSTDYRSQGFLRQLVRCTPTRDGILVDFEPRAGDFQPWWRHIEVRVHDWNGTGHADLEGRALKGLLFAESGTFVVTLDDQRGPARLSITHRSQSAEQSNVKAHTIQWRDQQASVVIEPAKAPEPGRARAMGRQSYRFSTLSGGADRAERVVSESAGQPTVRSGSVLFDGLFAMALADAQLDRVSDIRDDAFNEGRPIECACFETGEKWHYVWTRDISYSVDLGLAALDPERSRNSLLFKTSGVRPELLSDRLKQAALVAQDTGSGGSWPVSTDRVVWILAADDVLQYLPAAERPAAAANFFSVARDTLEQDRRFAFDAHVGLYRGETSFLDWREQNYPSWTRDDVSSIAAGYAFSTNVLHVIALEKTAQFARELHLTDSVARRYGQWAEDLKRAINKRFWQERAGLYASYLDAEPNSLPSNSYDLLGLSLAIIHGIADQNQARQILRRYPISAAGPPVLWPQQADVPIYHNRAIWPFVTAYALRAAKTAKHARLAEELAESLMRGAALSLSNMENFEFLTQRVRFEDGPLSGPVINSPRQLWSVAGYLSMVVDTLWGVEVRDGALSVSPWLPGRLARLLFADRGQVSLRDVRVGGASVTITLERPTVWPASGGSLEAATSTLNGERLSGSTVVVRHLRSKGRNELRVTLRAVEGAEQSITRIPFENSLQLTPAQHRAVFAPGPPVLTANARDDGVALTFKGLEPGATVQVYRNGRQLTANARGGNYDDRTARQPAIACYSLTQRFDDTGLTSPSSREMCVSTIGGSPVSAIPGTGLTPNDGSLERVVDGVARFADWGAASQELQSSFTAKATGWYRLEFRYANSQGPINTGITAAVKSVTARCADAPEQTGSVVMPHLNAATSWGYSSGFVFKAQAQSVCELTIADGFNMSYLEHFARYTAGHGGASGALNRADIAAAQVELMGE